MSGIIEREVTLQLSVAAETFPAAGTFTISRGSRSEATVVVATITDGAMSGRGECVPYARYGESVASVIAEIEAVPGAALADRQDLRRCMKPGAARNALDCALWDLELQRSGQTFADSCGLVAPAQPRLTCYTLSLDKPEAMAAKASREADKPLLKLKLGGAGDIERMRAVRWARPDARLVADANEGWTAADLDALLAAAWMCDIELIEQPLPADQDEALRGHPHPVPICADESAHTSADLPRLAGLYDAVNIKLDKAGGLTEALAMARGATAGGMKVMVGCMLSSSLAMAPALGLAPFADWLDLDGPLLLATDRSPGMTYRDGHIFPAPPGLWGVASKS